MVVSWAWGGEGKGSVEGRLIECSVSNRYKGCRKFNGASKIVVYKAAVTDRSELGVGSKGKCAIGDTLIECAISNSDDGGGDF